MPKRTMAVAVIMAVLTQQVSATNVSINQPTDSDLRGAAAAANTGDTIFWQPASGGLITISSGDLPTINNGVTLNVTNAGSAVTIASSSGAVPVAGVTTLFNDSASTWTVSASVIGNGSLTKAGAGALALTGVNTYLGGTTVSSGTLAINSDAALGAASGGLAISGGGLQALASLTSARSVSITTMAVIDTNGNSLTFSGPVGGGGGIVKVGTGTLSLTGSNSLGLGIVLNAGTLSAAGTPALGGGPLTLNAGSLQAAGSLVTGVGVSLGGGQVTFDTDGTTSALSGTITGVGGLVVVGTGALALSGANTFGGGVTLNAGILNINADAALGLTTGTLTLNGGTLQAAASFSSARNVSISGTGTIDTDSNDIIWSGVMSGVGGLVKVGSGTLTLNGNNSYSGGTLVSGGTLALGVNNALLTTGALTVGTGATFDMGSFTQSVGSYSGPGTLRLQLSPGVTNLNVAGQANFTNGTLDVSLLPQVIHAGDTFKPIVYGSSVAAFSAITGPAAISFTPTYNAGSLVLTAGLVPFARSAANPNQSAVGAALESLRANPTGDAATVIGNLYALDASRLRSALDEIGPAAMASMRGVGFSGASVQAAAVSRRMAVLADGTDRSRYSSYTVSRGSSYPGTLLAAAEDDTGAVDRAAQREASARSGWGFFTSGAVTAGRLADANSAGGAQPGYAFNSVGLTGGADRRLDEHLAVGASAGYSRGHASLYAPGGGSVDDQSGRFGLYAAGSGDSLRADLYVGGAVDSYSTRRRIVFGNIDRTALAQPLGTEFNLHPDVGYDFRTAQRGIFSPIAALNYDRLMIGGYSENGADSLDLDVGPQTAQSLQSTLGLRWGQVFTSGSDVFRPYLSAGWRHEYASQSRPIDARLASAGGGSFTVMTGDIARDGTTLGAGLAWDVGPRTTLKLDYAGDFRSHYQNSNVDGSFRFRW